jgi:adenine-specific DNA methylase
VNFKQNESAEKLRGSYYTPRPLARWLVRWALGGGARSVLEPGCGDGSFLEALGPRAQVTAIELDPLEAAKARRAHKGVVTGDFFAWLEANEGVFDAVVGNPPYIRYQYLEPGPRSLASALCERAGVPISKLTNAWVPFVLLSVERLAPRGRLAMVVPAEIMHVHHAEGLRRHLERSARSLTLVHIREMVFSGALQGVVLLLVEKRASEDERPCAPSIVEVESVAALPQGLEPRAEPLRRSGRWMWSLLAEDEARVLAAASEHATSFGDLASVDIGIVTGANDFFVADKETVDRYRLGRFVLPMLGRSEHVAGVRYTPGDHAANERAGRRVSFVALEGGTRLTKGLEEYLALGEELGLPARYKCRIREPWWAVPYVWRAPVSLLKRCHSFPRLVLNEANAYSTDTAYRIRPRGEPRDLVGSFLSTLTLLSAELEGRHYGGGVLELVPSEIERLLIAHAPTSARELAAIDRSVRRGRLPLDRQDARLLGGRLARDELLLLRGAWERLRARRLRKPAGPRPRAGP